MCTFATSIINDYFSIKKKCICIVKTWKYIQKIMKKAKLSNNLIANWDVYINRSVSTTLYI